MDVVSEPLLDFMAWNLGLALIPLALACWLFHASRTRGPVWWLGVVLFVLFLPNAPYVLTDVVHFVEAIRRTPHLPLWAITQRLIPAYVLFMFVGLQCYVVSLLLLRRYLQREGLTRWLFGVEVFVHALCAVGIYVGRILRFNSWDVFQEPARVLASTVQAFEARGALVHMVTNFVVLIGLCTVTRFINIAVLERWQRTRWTMAEGKRCWEE